MFWFDRYGHSDSIDSIMHPTTHQFFATRSASKDRSPFHTWALPIVLSLLLPTACLQAQSDTAAAARASDGEKMERQMWTDFKAKNWNAVESKIAEGFQSVHPDGARDRAGEISLIEHLDLGEFALNNFKSTTIGEDIVVTYLITVQETIDGKRLPTKPAPRLSVWEKGTSGWQWICHANLNPIP
jgi:hypothetical protein